MNNQKSFAPIIIVLIVVVLLAGGISAWQYLKIQGKKAEVPEETSPTSTADGGGKAVSPPEEEVGRIIASSDPIVFGKSVSLSVITPKGANFKTCNLYMTNVNSLVPIVPLFPGVREGTFQAYNVFCDDVSKYPRQFCGTELPAGEHEFYARCIDRAGAVVTGEKTKLNFVRGEMPPTALKFLSHIREKWQIGTKHVIRWTGGNPDATVWIYANFPSRLSKTIAPQGTPNTGSYVWKIPSTLSPGLYRLALETSDGEIIITGLNLTANAAGIPIVSSIENIRPAKGPIGMKIMITGSGFTLDGNTVILEPHGVPRSPGSSFYELKAGNVPSSNNGTRMTLEILPSNFRYGNCFAEICRGGKIEVDEILPGTYDLFVANHSCYDYYIQECESNKVSLTITSQ